MILNFDRNAERLSAIALERYKDGNLIGAILAYRSALEINPSSCKAAAGLAEAFYDVGRYRQALDCHMRALKYAESSEDNERAFNGACACLWRLGKKRDAFAYFLLQTEGKKHRYNEFNEELGKAKKEYEKHSRIPEEWLNVGGNYDRARKLALDGKPVEALGAAMDIGEDSPAVLSALELSSFLLAFVGENEKSQAVANAIISVMPSSVLARAALAKVRFESGNSELAEEDFARLMSMKITDSLQFVAVEMLSASLGRDDAVLKVANAALAANPFFPEALLIRGIALYNAGDRAGCVAELRKLRALVIKSDSVKNMLDAINSENPPAKLKYVFGVHTGEEFLAARELIVRMQKPSSEKEAKKLLGAAISIERADIFSLLLKQNDFAEIEPYLDDLLIETELGNEYKEAILRHKLIRGERAFAFVVSEKFHFVTINAEFKDYAGELFREAYSLAAAWIMAVAPPALEVFDVNCTAFKAAYEKNRGAEDANANALAAALLICAGINFGDKAYIMSKFSATEAEVEKISQLIRG